MDARARARPIDFWEDKVFEVVGIKSSCRTRVANFLNLTNGAAVNFSQFISIIECFNKIPRSSFAFSAVMICSGSLCAFMSRLFLREKRKREKLYVPT